jgi:hypothetical protein
MEKELLSPNNKSFKAPIKMDINNMVLKLGKTEYTPEVFKKA